SLDRDAGPYAGSYLVHGPVGERQTAGSVRRLQQPGHVHGTHGLGRAVRQRSGAYAQDTPQVLRHSLVGEGSGGRLSLLVPGCRPRGEKRQELPARAGAVDSGLSSKSRQRNRIVKIQKAACGRPSFFGTMLAAWGTRG